MKDYDELTETIEILKNTKKFEILKTKTAQVFEILFKNQTEDFNQEEK